MFYKCSNLSVAPYFEINIKTANIVGKTYETVNIIYLYELLKTPIYHKNGHSSNNLHKLSSELRIIAHSLSPK